MSAEKPDSRILIIEADDFLRKNLQTHFTEQGYQVTVATDGQTGLTQALNAYPSLILLALSLSDMTGQEAFRQLRSQPLTGHIPVMVLAGRDEVLAQKAFLEEGAYDFIEKPIDLDILTLRVRNALRRAEREGLTESRTGLPTGRLIDERLATLTGQPGWYRLDLTLTEFGTFRDQYGFVSANEVLRFAGSFMLQIVNEQGSARDFVGHRANSEDFVVLTTQTRGAHLRETLAERLPQELQSFYNFVDRDQGFVLVNDGSGTETKKPLMGVRITVEQGPPDPAAPPPDEDPWVDAVESEPKPQDSEESGTPSSPFDW